MLCFIIRMVSLDMLNAFPGGVVRVQQHHQVSKLNMEAKSVPLPLKLLKTDTSIGTNALKLQVMNREKVTLRSYWGVDIQIFHHVLRSPWRWFVQAFDKGNLFGSLGCCLLDPMIHLDPDPEQVVEIQIQSVDLGQAVPRTKYPLVLVAKYLT